MTRPYIFRSIPGELLARIRFDTDLAALDDVVDGDTINCWLLRTRGAPGYSTIRIRYLDKHELHDSDPVLRQLAVDERKELVTLLGGAYPVFSVTYQMTRTGNVVQSFDRAVASIVLKDGRDVATTLTPIRLARVARLREMGMYPHNEVLQ